MKIELVELPQLKKFLLKKLLKNQRLKLLFQIGELFNGKKETRGLVVMIKVQRL